MGDVGGFVQRWLLPEEFAAADEPPRRRSARDWVVDSLVFGGAVLLGWVAIAIALPPEPERHFDALLGLLESLSLWWRRRFPLGVALLAVPAQAFALSGIAAGIVIVVNLARRTPWRRSLPVVGLYAAVAVTAALLLPSQHADGWTGVIVIMAYYLTSYAWGSALRIRGMWVQAVRQEAEQQRTDHARRLADTRRLEREAIAREMHDVLAHRLSLLSVHAGALVYRTKRSAAGAGPNLSDAEVGQTAQVVRDNAYQALEELRDVLRVLSDADGRMAPQPELADVARLIDEARAAGQSVDLKDELGGRSTDSLRPQAQRTVYRVVQEGLTNARKHAPGATVTIRLTGAPGSTLNVEVANPLPVGAASRTAGSQIPGTGAGLVGLAERLRLEGGVLTPAGTDGAFTLRATLPWPVS